MEEEINRILQRWHSLWDFCFLSGYSFTEGKNHDMIQKMPCERKESVTNEMAAERRHFL
jgi:hypothetical protein